MPERTALMERIENLTGWKPHPARFKIIRDTSDWLNISRGDALVLEGRAYAARGCMRESRFGIDDQPKYWVLSCIDLEDGSEKIVKTEFHEEFHVHIGIFKIKCYRSPLKEEAALNAVRGDGRFMQGRGMRDDAGNNVRVIDYINGKSLFKIIPEIKKNYIDYYREDLPALLLSLRESFRAIEKLHERGYYHGDIRTDHLILDSRTGLFRWIDFDLNQNVSDFDLWSMGNILCYAAGKGIVTFDAVMKDHAVPGSVKKSLGREDASAFYEYRVMNLGKVFPCISPRLGAMLLKFTTSPAGSYESLGAFLQDYDEMLDEMAG